MNRISLLALATAAILTGACSTEPQGTQLSLTLATTMAVNSAGATPGTETYTDGQNTLTLTQVEIVLREVELKPVEIADCDAIPEPTECRDFEIGPTLVPVPLGTIDRTFVISVDPGSYDELELNSTRSAATTRPMTLFARRTPTWSTRAFVLAGRSTARHSYMNPTSTSSRNSTWPRQW